MLHGCFKNWGIIQHPEVGKITPKNMKVKGVPYTGKAHPARILEYYLDNPLDNIFSILFIASS